MTVASRTSSPAPPSRLGSLPAPGPRPPASAARQLGRRCRRRRRAGSLPDWATTSRRRPSRPMLSSPRPPFSRATKVETIVAICVLRQLDQVVAVACVDGNSQGDQTVVPVGRHLDRVVAVAPGYRVRRRNTPVVRVPSRRCYDRVVAVASGHGVCRRVTAIGDYASKNLDDVVADAAVDPVFRFVLPSPSCIHGFDLCGDGIVAVAPVDDVVSGATLDIAESDAHIDRIGAGTAGDAADDRCVVARRSEPRDDDVVAVSPSRTASTEARWSSLL